MSCLVSMCGSVLMMHLLVSNDSGHMVTPSPAGLFDVVEYAHTSSFLKISNTCTSAHTLIQLWSGLQFIRAPSGAVVAGFNVPA